MKQLRTNNQSGHGRGIKMKDLLYMCHLLVTVTMKYLKTKDKLEIPIRLLSTELNKKFRSFKLEPDIN